MKISLILLRWMILIFYANDAIYQLRNEFSLISKTTWICRIVLYLVRMSKYWFLVYLSLYFCITFQMVYKKKKVVYPLSNKSQWYCHCSWKFHNTFQVGRTENPAALINIPPLIRRASEVQDCVKILFSMHLIKLAMQIVSASNYILLPCFFPNPIESPWKSPLLLLLFTSSNRIPFVLV